MENVLLLLLLYNYKKRQGYRGVSRRFKDTAQQQLNKKLSYCWETVRRESMPRIAEIDVEMTT